MKDFFGRQDEARRRTVHLVFLFGLAVLGVALAVYLAAALVCFWTGKGAAADIFRHPGLFLWTTGGTLLFVGLGSLWKIHEMREGGSKVAAILGGRPVPPQTGDPRERRLCNVVEEMAIASGVPVPDIFLLERERGINAFAAGHGLGDAVICVTRGALELLSRDELQGVVAHEFSHILNGDMRLNMRLLGWLNGILLLGQAGETVFRVVRTTGGRWAGPLFFAATALYGIGYVGYFFGRLIKCAVSRQREYLGDASAVQFTRYPDGLSGALKKIGGLPQGSRLDHPRAGEVSHLFFSNGLREAWLHALDSHPPLTERLLRLDPSFNGIFPPVTPLPAPPPQEGYIRRKPAAATAKPAVPLPIAAVTAILDRIGDPLREHLDRARQLIAGLPEQIVSAARDPIGARAVVCGLLMDHDPAIRARQEEILNATGDGAIVAEMKRLSPDLGALPPELRLPLVELTLPSLRRLSREEFLLLKATVEQLSGADNRTSLFEFTLRYLLLRHLEPHFSPRRERPAQIYGIRGVHRECSCVLTALARVGRRDEVGAGQAFEKGVSILMEVKAEFTFVPAAECGPASLERAFGVLEGASLPIKRRLLAACLECLLFDGTVTVAEMELFRAIADAVGCPLPPWLESSRAGS